VIRETRPGLPGAWCELVAELHSLAGQSKEAASCVLEAGRRAPRQGALETATSSLRKARELAELHNDSDQLAAIDDALITALGLAGNYAPAGHGRLIQHPTSVPAARSGRWPGPDLQPETSL